MVHLVIERSLRIGMVRIIINVILPPNVRVLPRRAQRGVKGVGQQRGVRCHAAPV
jgi:hypothetical protein